MKIKLLLVAGIVIFGITSCSTSFNSGFTKKKYLRIGALNPSDESAPVFFPSPLNDEAATDEVEPIDFSGDELIPATEESTPAETTEKGEIIQTDDVFETDFSVEENRVSNPVEIEQKESGDEKDQIAVSNPPEPKRKPDNLDKLYYVFVAILFAMFICLAIAFTGYWQILVLFWALLIAEFIISIAIAVLASTLGKTVPSKEASDRRQTGVFVGIVSAIFCGGLALLGFLILTFA